MADRIRATLSASLLLCGLFVVSGCAARATMPPMPTTLRHPDFRYPTAPQDAPALQVARLEIGWRYLQSDNLRGAERAFSTALEEQPTFYPAATALGYLELARRESKDAAEWFDKALQLAADYVPALLGRGQALLELNRDTDALASFEAALKADPSLTELKGRIELLRFRALQDSLDRAKRASDASQWDEARAAYQQAIAASPESAFLYRDLAIVERRAGQTALALEHFQKAIALDPNDARSYAQVGVILEEQGDATAALAAYEKARSLDPSEVGAEVLNRLRDSAALARLPAEYRAIPTAETITRADVAALIGIRLAPLLSQATPRQVVITDVRANWAQQWILSAVRAGVMDAQADYTFQPALRVRRGDLAQTVARVLALIATRSPAAAKAWQGARPKIADVPPAHLAYPAVSQAVASGVMPLEAGNFQLLRPVTGAEAATIIGRLEALARP